MNTPAINDSDRRAILRRRAAELARVPVVDDRADETLEVVEFSLAGERYGAGHWWMGVGVLARSCTGRTIQTRRRTLG